MKQRSYNFSQLQAAVFDWAGTTVDFGCQGPVQAFASSFAAFDILVTVEEARGPMGMDKREHVAAMCAMPRIHAMWQERYGCSPTTKDIDRIYEHVSANMLNVITAFASPIRGIPEAVEAMRAAGLQIGSCTGYPREVAEKLAAFAKDKGYAPDTLVAATDVKNSRPAPDMCLAILDEFGITEPWRAVKIGDTPNDVSEGINAGMWTVGITLSGSLVGLSPQELMKMPQAERHKKEEQAAEALRRAGAHFVARDVGQCFRVLQTIDKLAESGQKPSLPA